MITSERAIAMLLMAANVALIGFVLAKAPFLRADTPEPFLTLKERVNQSRLQTDDSQRLASETRLRTPPNPESAHGENRKPEPQSQVGTRGNERNKPPLGDQGLPTERRGVDALSKGGRNTQKTNQRHEEPGNHGATPISVGLEPSGAPTCSFVRDLTIVSGTSTDGQAMVRIHETQTDGRRDCSWTGRGIRYQSRGALVGATDNELVLLHEENPATVFVLDLATGEFLTRLPHWRDEDSEIEIRNGRVHVPRLQINIGKCIPTYADLTCEERLDACWEDWKTSHPKEAGTAERAACNQARDTRNCSIALWAPSRYDLASRTLEIDGPIECLALKP